LDFKTSIKYFGERIKIDKNIAHHVLIKVSWYLIWLEEGPLKIGNIVFTVFLVRPFFYRQGEILSPGPERLVSESGTKATPFVRI
jgi:hypothetical protein